MKTINIEGVRLSEKAIVHLKMIQEPEVNTMLMNQALEINRDFVLELGAGHESNEFYIEGLKWVSTFMELIQLLKQPISQ